MDLLEAKLDELDKLNKLHNVDKDEKRAKIEALVSEFFQIFKENEDQLGVSTGQMCLLQGRAWDNLPDRVKEAEQLLQKAVKLEPTSVKAWNGLGNCFWKKRDLKNAHNCFAQALQQAKNKESLRSLSMIVRQIHDGKERTEDVISKSVDFAKQAIALDMKDPESWYTCANAYVAQFFSADQEMATLKRALSAYKKSEDLEGGESQNPDLYYNRANLLKHFENFAEAAENYKKAEELDPNLSAQGHIDNMHRLVIKLDRLVSTSAGMKKKKITQLCSTIPDTLIGTGAKSRTLLSCGELQEGENNGKAVCMSVVAPVNKAQQIPVTLIGIDKNEGMFVVSVYNTVPAILDTIKTGDLIQISEPIMKTVALNELKYVCIQVENPALFLLNGKPLTKIQLASAELGNKFFV